MAAGHAIVISAAPNEALFASLIAIEERSAGGTQNIVGSRNVPLPHEDRTKKTRACEEERDESR